MIKFIEEDCGNAEYGIISEKVVIKATDTNARIIKPLYTIKTARNMGVAVRGEKVRYTEKNGYDHERKRASELIQNGQFLTVKSVRIDDFCSSYEFEELEGEWNTVMFELVKNKT